jgi:hypothetical protein
LRMIMKVYIICCNIHFCMSKTAFLALCKASRLTKRGNVITGFINTILINRNRNCVGENHSSLGEPICFKQHFQTTCHFPFLYLRTKLKIYRSHLFTLKSFIDDDGAA